MGANVTERVPNVWEPAPGSRGDERHPGWDAAPSQGKQTQSQAQSQAQSQTLIHLHGVFRGLELGLEEIQVSRRRTSTLADLGVAFGFIYIYGAAIILFLSLAFISFLGISLWEGQKFVHLQGCGFDSRPQLCLWSSHVLPLPCSNT